MLLLASVPVGLTRLHPIVQSVAVPNKAECSLRLVSLVLRDPMLDHGPYQGNSPLEAIVLGEQGLCIANTLYAKVLFVVVCLLCRVSCSVATAVCCRFLLSVVVRLI